jgi:hypothetical protein
MRKSGRSRVRSVPRDAEPGTHRVSTVCEDARRILVVQRFDVTAGKAQVAPPEQDDGPPAQVLVLQVPPERRTTLLLISADAVRGLYRAGDGAAEPCAYRSAGVTRAFPGRTVQQDPRRELHGNSRLVSAAACPGDTGGCAPARRVVDGWGSWWRV